MTFIRRSSSALTLAVALLFSALPAIRAGDLCGTEVGALMSSPVFDPVMNSYFSNLTVNATGPHQFQFVSNQSSDNRLMYACTAMQANFCSKGGNVTLEWITASNLSQHVTMTGFVSLCFPNDCCLGDNPYYCYADDGIQQWVQSEFKAVLGSLCFQNLQFCVSADSLSMNLVETCQVENPDRLVLIIVVTISICVACCAGYCVYAASKKYLAKRRAANEGQYEELHAFHQYEDFTEPMMTPTYAQ